jgi:two-component system, NtrC family, response regulator HydG
MIYNLCTMKMKKGGSKKRDRHSLGPEDREFFVRISEAFFMNPFSDELVVITRLIPNYTPEKYPEEHFLWTLGPILKERIARLGQRGLTRIQQFSEADRRFVENAFLLENYLRFVPEIDQLIQKQVSAGGTTIDVPFREEAIALFHTYGFSDQDSLRYFALYFQLRRAYHLINTSLVGDCPSMKNLRFALWNNVFTYDLRTYGDHLLTRMEDFSTLILGETGTGKGAAAAAIGRSGFIPFDSKKGCFPQSFMEMSISVNLSQFPESLIESELFGHRKGAFTGAVDNHEGLFELCGSYGSLFLDEIGDLPISVQIKLLQVLQERVFSPVGSHILKRFKGRVIAATNRSIEDLRKEGRFRDDFFYRLCSDVILVPTLRQRISESSKELEQLVKSLIKRITGEESESLTGMILETLHRDLPSAYPWPGNVRELEQALRRILLNRHYKGDLLAMEPDLEENFVQKIQMGKIEAKELLSEYCNFLYQRFQNYEEVARRTQLDRRTVKKYITNASQQ